MIYMITGTNAKECMVKKKKNAEGVERKNKPIVLETDSRAQEEVLSDC